MGVATISSTAHAESYQNLENYWKATYPDSKVDFVTAAKQGNGDAWRLTTQLDGYKANNNVQQSNSQSVTNNNSHKYRHKVQLLLTIPQVQPLLIRNNQPMLQLSQTVG